MHQFFNRFMKIDIVSLEIKKVCSIEINTNSNRIFGVEDGGPIFCDLIGSSNVEVVGVLCLDNTNKIINFSCISIGNIENVKVSLPQLFRVVLVSNASKVIIGHNHPSGVLEITDNDIEMTKK